MGATFDHAKYNELTAVSEKYKSACLLASNTIMKGDIILISFSSSLLIFRALHILHP